MEVIKTPIEGLLIIEPKVFGDERGYFIESYQEKRYQENGMPSRFVQDNEAFSKYGVVRGLHYQHPPFAQTKLVRVIQGKVFDVAVDLRRNSPTFGQWYGIELSAENKRQLYIPQGFAHGYSVLSETSLFAYKCDNLYAPGNEGGIFLFDEELGIDWQIPEKDRTVSEKDQKLPVLKLADIRF